MSFKQDALIMQNMQRFSIPHGRDKSEIWAAIEARIKETKVEKVKKLNLTWVKFAAAASVALAVGVFYMLNNAATSIATNVGEQVSFYLPDSSKVYLNASSSITYSKEDWEGERLVELEGEAFFKVKKGKAFKVVSDEGVVEVLGTSFNVLAREQEYIVDCLTGRVKVSTTKLDNYQILTPGLSSTIKNNQVLFVSRHQRGPIAPWRFKEFVYDDSALTDVIQELEKQFDIKISYGNVPIEQRRYTGFFNTQSLDESLERVFPPMGLTYTKINEIEIVISDEKKSLQQE